MTNDEKQNIPLLLFISILIISHQITNTHTKVCLAPQIKEFVSFTNSFIFEVPWAGLCPLRPLRCFATSRRCGSGSPPGIQ